MQIDKLLHILAGAVIAALVLLVANPIAAIAAALLVGAAKEWVWDAWLGKGTFDPMDFAATVAGGAGMAAIHLVVEKAIALL